MFSVVLSNLIENPQRMESLDNLAENQIKIRGYHLYKVVVPPELKRREWFLPVNLIAGEYCPTRRYLYLKKFKENVKPKLTWEAFQGKVVDDLYKSLFNEFYKYTNSTELKKLYVKEELENFQAPFLDKVQKEIERNKSSMLSTPEQEEIEGFIFSLKKILRYETQLCSSIIDFKISMKRDINLKAEIALLFPFNFKVKINAPDLGFSEGVEPDFIFAEKVMGDIKTGEWREFFNLTIAAYALAYENEHRRNMNLGVIINPTFTENRTVPCYPHSSIEIIEDRYRKAVLTIRDEKLEMMKSGEDPNTPSDETLCYSCGYFSHCWGRVI